MALKDLPRVGERELAIIVGVEGADPRVEHLHGVDAGVNLRDQIVGDERSPAVGEAMPGRRIAVHQALGEGEVVRVPAFDGVRGQRERRAGKPDERHASRRARV